MKEYTMGSNLSIQARRELIENIRLKYHRSDWQTKRSLLNGFIAATGYQRKYAISLLNKSSAKQQQVQGIGRKPIYDEAVQQALIQLWRVANQICAKRLIPFLPDLIEACERHGHLSLPVGVRKKLLTISVATADRLLRKERQIQKKGIINIYSILPLSLKH